jgi:hypothetical protein
MNNLSLYHLTNEHQRLLSQLYDYETGEVDLEVEAQLSALSDTTEKKCIAIASYMKSIEADKAQLDHFKKELAEREDAYDKKLIQLHDYLKSNMERQKMTEVSCPYFTIKIKKNPMSTDILNEKDIPAHFIKTREIVKVESKPDKNAIKEEVLRTGLQIPGAYVHQKTKLEIITDRL